jgi:hypothetical protein
MKYRVFERGWRRIGGKEALSGILIKCGSIIEQFDEEKQIWIYVDCVHPDDVTKITKFSTDLTFIKYLSH